MWFNKDNELNEIKGQGGGCNLGTQSVLKLGVVIFEIFFCSPFRQLLNSINGIKNWKLLHINKIIRLRWLLSDSVVCTQKNTNRRDSCLYLTCSTHKSCIFWVQLVLTINHCEQVCTRKHVSLSGSCYRFTAAVFTDELGRHRQEDWSPLILLQARKQPTFQSECTNVISCMNLHWHIRSSIFY